MNEPIKDRGELNEAEEDGGEFVVTRADPDVAFDAAEGILYLMTAAIVTAVEQDAAGDANVWRNAGVHVLPPQTRAKGVGIKSLVADRVAMAHAGGQRPDQIMALASRLPKCDGAAPAFGRSRPAWC